MPTVVVTGSGGLIGSESARHFHALGWDVVGVDNDMRAEFFGPDASTAWMTSTLARDLARFRHFHADIRDSSAVVELFRSVGTDCQLVIHAAAQPSHDWAARDPQTDFAVNANGTLNLLEATRQFSPEATFLFTSTNKVYGDTPNSLPLVELATRFELEQGHAFWEGIPTSMTIDQSTHSLFGVSKTAADLLVQEYGRYFGMNTAVFRGGCLTGPGHSGTELHGFLAYLMRCAATGREYTVFGYQGKQVRDNIHSADLVAAFAAAAERPRSGAVYNLGGGRASNCSVLEAIALCQEVTGRELNWNYVDDNRVGDHMWWISDLSSFQDHYPAWQLRYDIRQILTEIFESNRSRWNADPVDRSR